MQTMDSTCCSAYLRWQLSPFYCLLSTEITSSKN